MYAYKVMVSTLLLVLIAVMAFSVVKAPLQTKYASLVVTLIQLLSLIAIWG